MSGGEASAFDYDAGWGVWDDMKRFGPMSRHCRRLVWKLVSGLDFASVLDVGAGQGSVLERIRAERPGVQVAAVDISAQAIELARRRLPGAELFVLDISRAALPRQFDLVLCNDVIEHIDQHQAALENLRRMTRRWCLVNTLQGRMREAERSVGHLRNYRRGEVAERMRAAGFRVVRELEWGFPLYSPLYRNLLDHVAPAATTGRYGPGRKLLSLALYAAFLLNSSRRGDYVFVLGEAV